ncbi:unnamed protein product [Owenia fusiformis]|uniref:TIR domain-containing protein n=1 Tax=Owenia fusiformis TaxID=6347 RepID=A0A8S4Q575_OWEFU|nr:unnamed protein product [Owenia fusiformis]
MKRETDNDFWVMCNEKSPVSCKRANYILTLLEEKGLRGYFTPRDAKNKDSLIEITEAVDKCKYILIVFDEDFKKDNFNMFTQESVFKKLIDTGQLPRFIPLVIGVKRREAVPSYIPNFCLEFNDDWKEDDRQFARLESTLRSEPPMSIFGF